MTKLNKKLIIVIIAIIVIAGGVAGYFYRVAIMDYLRVLERESVPEAVSFDEEEQEAEKSRNW